MICAHHYINSIIQSVFTLWKSFAFHLFTYSLIICTYIHHSFTIKYQLHSRFYPENWHSRTNILPHCWGWVYYTIKQVQVLGWSLNWESEELSLPFSFTLTHFPVFFFPEPWVPISSSCLWKKSRPLTLERHSLGSKHTAQYVGTFNNILSNKWMNE